MEMTEKNLKRIADALEKISNTLERMQGPLSFWKIIRLCRRDTTIRKSTCDRRNDTDKN